MKTTIPAILVCLALANTYAGELPQTNRFTIADLAKMARLSDPQISPDGKSVVIVVSRPNYDEKRYDNELVLVDVATGSQRVLTRDRQGVEQPRWSPSGDRLAFIAKTGAGKEEKAQLFVMSMEGGDASRLTSVTNGVQHFAWRPDGKEIAFATADEPENKQQIEKGNDAFEIGDDSFLTAAAATPSHIWLISAQGGQPRRLTSGAWSLTVQDDVVPLSWSPDGRSIAFTRQATPHFGDNDLITVNILDVATGAIRPLTKHTFNEAWPAYSPDGSSIAYRYPRDGLLTSVNELYVAPAGGGEGKNLTRPLDRDIGRSFWIPDGKSLLVVAYDGTRVSAWLQPLEGEARRLDLGNLNPDGFYSESFEMDAGKDGSIAFVGSYAHSPLELYSMSSPSAPPRQLTRFNESVAALALGKVEPMEWQGPDGWREDGILIYPPDFGPGKKYPLVLFIHGGPEWASTEAFNEWGQLIAAHGYVVFRPNYRGSNNRGNAYETAIINDIGDGPGRDIMSGLEAVEKRGFVETNRIAVTGWSYGGYMTVWLIGHYQVWKTAIAGAAVTDLLADYNLCDGNVQDRYLLGGSPWVGDRAKAYAEQSPISYASKIRTPTLILSDTGDERVPITQSYELYHALRDNGVPTKFIAYPTSGHHPKDPVRYRDIYRRWIEWLDQYLAQPAEAFTYPPARRGDVVDDYSGVKVADPYRWLENLDSPETRAWITAEAGLTESYLEKVPALETIKQRLTSLLNFEKYGTPFHKGTRYFYSLNSGLQQQSVLYTTIGLSGAPTVALDPNVLSTNGSLAVVGYVASQDGTELAYGTSPGGSDWTEWHIRDVASGKDLPDVLRWTKYYRPIFAPDGKGLYYSGFPAPPPGEELRARDLGNTVYYHALGTPQSSDRKLYARSDHPDWQFEPHLTQDGRWLVVIAGEGEVGDKGLMNVYALDLNAAQPLVVPITESFDAAYLYAGAAHGLLFFQTTLDAPRCRVIAINPATPERSRWKEIVPQGADAMDATDFHGPCNVTLVADQLVVRTLHDAHSKVTLYELDGHLRREVELPSSGEASGFAGEPDDQETFFVYTDFVTPETIYRLDMKTGVSTVYRKPKVAFDPGTLESKQVFYPGKDGTLISMYLVYQKGLKLDGRNPTLLYGYGGFGIPILPRFDPARLVWLERGGVYAIANIRGGGEYGEDWHRQGIRAHKQVVFDDFIAAAEWLIAQQYTSTPKLAIEGGSNGGLLVGACLTQRPGLFGAALAYVGVMDMLRFDQFGQGAGWEGDYGSPHNSEDFKALYAYSPYHNVRPGTRYPATLVVTGDHDSRVMPAHSFKFVAALQAAQAGNAPLLLRVQLSAGHGGGPNTSQIISEKADAYAFLVQALGVDEK